MIRQPRSFDRFGGYRCLEQGVVVIRLDIVRRRQTIVSRIFEAHARRVCEAHEVAAGEQALAAPTYPTHPAA